MKINRLPGEWPLGIRTSDWPDSLWNWIVCSYVWRPPKYEPNRWNDNDGIQFTNNCYNYACNLQNGTYAQPGRSTGNQYAALTCNEVIKGALSDGLHASTDVAACGSRCHKVALVVAPNWDFHWYRLDENGTWSHKPGGTQATNLDNSGNLITDPRTADRGFYTEFCGFFCVCCGKVTIG